MISINNERKRRTSLMIFASYFYKKAGLFDPFFFPFNPIYTTFNKINNANTLVFTLLCSKLINKTTLMKKTLFILLTLVVFSCSKNDELDLKNYNENLSIVENLNNGVAVLEIADAVGIDALHGLEFGGGFIFHVDETDGSLLVARTYTSVGEKSWGDHFDLTNGELLGDGQENTNQIVEGNLNDNSNVPNGLEFGSDDYVFKIVDDLVFEASDDWFIPSRASAEAIYTNVFEKGVEGFNEQAFYWTSTKRDYAPFVMSFNPNFEGKAFLGTCFGQNSILIARKIQQ